MIKMVTTQEAPAAIGPYSQAVAAGPWLFTSGQIPLRPDGSLVTGDIREQAAQVLANLDAVLQTAGVNRTDVVKTTIFLSDLQDFEQVNQVYGEFFGTHRPARSTVQVAALPKGARVEIEVIAWKEI